MNVDPFGLARLSEDLRLGPVIQVEPLGGGLGATPLRVVFATGAIVVKAYESAPESASREHASLEAATAIAIPTPVPLGLDLSGAWLGDPAVAMSWLDGTPFFPADPGDEWTGSLATAPAAIHRAPVPAAPVEEPDRLLASLRSPTVRDRRLQRIATAVEDLFAQPDGDVVFSHGDYHPGNVLFRDGRVTGVVDLFDAGPRSRASDVAYCRGVLAVHPAGDVPDRFLRAYESETGRPLSCDRWDALWAARGFLGARGRWPAALASLGVMITGIEIEQRNAMWAEAALGRLERG